MYSSHTLSAEPTLCVGDTMKKATCAIAYTRSQGISNGLRPPDSLLMKSTKVQNPRRIPRIKPARLLATPRDVAVLPGQWSLLRGLAASVFIMLSLGQG